MVLGHREIADMITSLICHGTLTRFPKLRIASVENGSSWIHPLFDDFEDLYKKMPQNFPEHPHDVFRRNIWVSPFWEGCVADVVETVGWDKVLVRIGLPASRRPGRTEGILEVRRGHGRTSYLRLHGRQRPPVHGSADRQPRPRRRQAACHGERVTSKVR